ncbi:alpha/beta fold hydrolase [Streptomyces sp. VRA16 Mangrove soil]|uniref:alpha/beta fold hydrolase n=1 Tax=Streptomyces sp. VRA16 Mangrove soil TaxID=2817434 RepID=UPI001A9FAE80|nr:alpha/beta fold hydrolase [Streptomyces sp. VRA16 Mangrove soil]MBO1337059.1 alpha/beta fold hydrolase [Streptomyces sp. VRA16 Mangrove soil]
MSRPVTFTPPPGTRAHLLRTARGEFAALTGEPEPGRPERGTALLLPGFTGSKEDFIALHAPLGAAGYRTVAVDGRGQYESQGPKDDESPYAQAELAQDVLAQVAALDAPGPVHLLGHSLGGLIARAAVIADPAPFASLTLMASGPAAVAEPQQQRVKLLQDALAALDMAQVWEAIQALEPPEDAADVRDDTGGVRDDLRRRWMANSPAQLIATGRQLCTEPDRVDELAALAPPVHVVSGERDDTWPVPLLDEMARRLGAERSVIAGAEHSPNTDRPLETAAALAAFWDGRTPNRSSRQG